MLNIKNKPKTMTDKEYMANVIEILFGGNDYRQILVGISPLKNLLKDMKTLEKLQFVELDSSSSLVDYYGKINLKLSQEMSDSFLNTDTKNISFCEFEQLPFDCFRIDMSYFSGVDGVVVYKEIDKIYLQLQNVNNKGLNINFKIIGNDIILEETHSSTYHNRELSKITKETYDIAHKCKDYVLSILFYLVSFQNDSESVVQDMSYDYFISKIPLKKQSKPKYQKILNSKVNSVTLQLNSKPSSTNNTSYSQSTKEIQTTFLVRGHWRKQRVGTRDSYTTKRIWIRPFFKGVDSDNLRNKIYKVS